MLPVGTEAAVRRGSTKDYKWFYRGSTKDYKRFYRGFIKVIKDVI